MMYPGEQIIYPQENLGYQSEKIKMSIEMYSM